MTSSSKIIRGTEVTAEVAPWNVPAVAEMTNGARAKETPPAQEDLAQVRERAAQQGFEQGRAQGLEAGRSDLQQHAELLRRVLDGLARPVQTLDQQFEEEVFALVTALARQLVRRELKLDQTHIIGIIREGLAALPAASTNVQVRLHPQDAELVREMLQPDTDDRPWSIEPDPLMEQGGCRIVTESAQIDGRLDTRLGRVVAAMLEDERAPRD